MNLFPYSILILPNVNSSQCWINSADVVRKMTSTMRLWHSALLFILASAVAVPQATAASGWNFVKKNLSNILHFISQEKLTHKKSWAILQNFNFWMKEFTVVYKKRHLTPDNLAKLVFWSILSFKNRSFSKLLSYSLSQFLSWEKILRDFFTKFHPQHPKHLHPITKLFGIT